MEDRPAHEGAESGLQAVPSRRTEATFLRNSPGSPFLPPGGILTGGEAVSLGPGFLVVAEEDTRRTHSNQREFISINLNGDGAPNRVHGDDQAFGVVLRQGSLQPVETAATDPNFLPNGEES